MSFSKLKFPVYSLHRSTTPRFSQTKLHFTPIIRLDHNKEWKKHIIRLYHQDNDPNYQNARFLPRNKNISDGAPFFILAIAGFCAWSASYLDYGYKLDDGALQENLKEINREINKRPRDPKLYNNKGREFVLEILKQPCSRRSVIVCYKVASESPIQSSGTCQQWHTRRFY
jgi:hypothetical protein